ncbi:sodium:glutamate symporter [Corynebacterium falsenii DSM 44353]|uniref:sodium/glutamate symporter n=1 Tax=Corynebacterium falsenii TaxID=108486 RepID=UPI0003E96257|nr:sodium/glutamate symporter [Corynebacterium falsenii]AHI02399.1 sodium:glutamate symporter [Corynebacterium falsenii DSM 44353]MDC7104317.1 sodium/glutamate symporter [Corynebacterium falsenii]UBI05174.1 sodium:glutamate symporter [Corynebacterium falsenii]
MDFTPYDLMVDVGLISVLMIVGTFMRRHFQWFRRLLIPAPITAGLLALALGPQVLGIMPFSDSLSTYSTILIAVVFAAMPYSMAFASGSFAKARNMWAYSTSMFLGQWGIFILLGAFVFAPLFGTPDWFGMMLPVGFVGGFGTAAAVGGALDSVGMEAASSLGFTAATLGTLAAIVGGIIFANWGIRTGRTNTLPEKLPWELRSGEITDEDKQPSIGKATTNPSSIEPLALHVGFITVTVMIAYFLKQWLESIFPELTIPLFALSFVVGVGGRIFLRVINRPKYLDAQTVRSISGASTDYLIAFGIASIVPSAVAGYLVPLLILFAAGVVYCTLIFFLSSPLYFGDQWLERGIFGWGWATASVATGIALLKIVDPDLKSGTLDDYGVAYVGFAPFEIGMNILAPIAVLAGFLSGLGGVALVVAVGVFVVPFFLGWMPNHGKSSGKGGSRGKGSGKGSSAASATSNAD